MLELTQELKTRGNDITVITTWPEYNLEDGSSRNFLEIEKKKMALLSLGSKPFRITMLITSLGLLHNF